MQVRKTSPTKFQNGLSH